jgi:hypothetical protein
MDGAASGLVPGHNAQGHFTPGHSEYAARRRRIEMKVKTLTDAYDCQTAAQRMMLKLAAVSLDTAETTRKALTRERSANVALRLLADIPKRKKKPKRTRIVTMAEIEAMERSSHGKA